MSNKDVLKGLANNEALFEATKKIILEHFEEVPFSEGASDELLGQITRARHVGRQKVEEAFRKIASYKTIPKSPDKGNPAYWHVIVLAVLV